ncbi:MAG: glutathione S-transferase [Betaproteobacteria bacterium]|nr:glutathione S-transferase [Betaproteobacteria bacterium]
MSAEASIVLYRHPLSGHCHRVELLLNMLGLPYRIRDVDLRAGEQRQPAFLAINPFGQLPVIDDAGTVVADSNAILVYLAMRYGAPSWLPRDALGAARVQRWLSLAAGPLAYGAARARAIRVFGRATDPAEPIATAQALFERMDALLDGESFLTGAEPTIADLAMYSYTAHAPEGGVSLEPYPHLRAWLARVQALPGFVAMQASPTA